MTNEKKEIPKKEESKEVSEVIKAMRQRREDMATRNERKLEKEKERLAFVLYVILISQMREYPVVFIYAICVVRRCH